mgnify:CR=1 FL=1
MKILCKLGIHKWSEWRVHPFRGNWCIRQCQRCFRWQDKKEF